MNETSNNIVVIWLLKQLESKGLLDTDECAAITSAYLSKEEKASEPAA